CQISAETTTTAGRAHTARRARSRAISSSGSPPATGSMVASVTAAPPWGVGLVALHVPQIAVVQADHGTGEGDHGRKDGEDRPRSQPAFDHEGDEGEHDGRADELVGTAGAAQLSVELAPLRSVH